MKIIQLIIALSVIVGCTSRATNEAVDADVYYTCSMDPQVIESKPGNCPICKMPLTAVRKVKGNASKDFTLSDQQIELGYITTDTMREESIGEELVLTGRLVWNENYIQVISTRAAGRVDRLYVKTVGEVVDRGQPLFMFYSETINSAVRELELAQSRRSTFPQESELNEKMIRAARAKLTLYGLTVDQIASVIGKENPENTVPMSSPISGTAYIIAVREGEYVREGTTIMQIANPQMLWAEAEVYPDDLMKLAEPMMVALRFPSVPAMELQGKIAFVEPESDGKTRVTRVRVEVNNAKGVLKPGMQVEFVIVVHQKRAKTLPIDAVVLGKEGSSVWIEVDDNQFRNVMVTTGFESGGRVEILSGLQTSDQIVVSGSYLLNSEYLMKRGEVPMSDHKHN